MSLVQKPGFVLFVNILASSVSLQSQMLNWSVYFHPHINLILNLKFVYIFTHFCIEFRIYQILVYLLAPRLLADYRGFTIKAGEPVGQRWWWFSICQKQLSSTRFKLSESLHMYDKHPILLANLTDILTFGVRVGWWRWFDLSEAIVLHHGSDDSNT